MSETVYPKIIDIADARSGSQPIPMVRDHADAEHIEAQQQIKVLHLTAVLQTTLELETLLNLFTLELGSQLSHDGLAFHCDLRGIDLLLGKKTAHQCSYTIRLQDKQLGQLEIMRAKKFSDTEITLFETMLAALVYPLRNALSYRDACNASLSDPLTGIANRAGLDKVLAHEIALARRNQTPFSVVMADVDHFKRVNDNYGHNAGDEVLKTVVKCLGECIRTTDYIARHGGEEFMILLNNTNAQGAARLCERIAEAMRNVSCLTDGLEPIRVTLSLGIAEFTAKDTAKDLLKRADAALYMAKDAGRNCARYLSED